MGEQCREDFAALAKGLLGIRAIFGSDLTAPPMAAAIGAHLRDLLDRDPRGYLSELASHE
jgi:hypothetical protein